MKIIITTIVVLLSVFSCEQTAQNEKDYEGEYCSGKGDVKSLHLLDESMAFFHPNPVVPNLSMVYNPAWNTLAEGAGWGGGAWWIQNSYGFSYSATPFLQEPWITMLQNSWDLFWDKQGDGKRMGDPFPQRAKDAVIAPDGSLGDAAWSHKIVYKQGDGSIDVHDWFYEATAAGVVMEAEILLSNRNNEAIAYYLPKMERACNFIERTRDSTNNLFLVGPASNLMAPSYGGVKQPDGSFGKGYLSGLSITYLAALDRMVELYKLIGDKGKLKEYRHRQMITRESLPLLKAPAGYFVKSVEPGGVKHGVLGQEKYGYLEGVANADAVALRVADDNTAKKIYAQIKAFPDIRPFDFLLTNAPGLDDTFWNWGHTEGGEIRGFRKFGDWVNGGVWGTVEGRAILMYSRLGEFNDVFRSASRAMKWAKDFRMDAPWSQMGENTNNSWSDSGRIKFGNGVVVMIDNFAIPAATIRGLFDYEYKYDRIILRPRIPSSISEYSQKVPVRFGNKKLFISCVNGGSKIKRVKINGKKMKVNSKDEVALLYDNLPENATIEITTSGGWSSEIEPFDYPMMPELISCPMITPSAENMPQQLQAPFTILMKMKEQLANEPGANYEKAFVDAAIGACESYLQRTSIDPGKGYFRAITPERKKDTERFYLEAALAMVDGFEQQMKNYMEKGDARKKRIAELFFNIKQ
jgi:hypothetical protein